MFNKKYDFIIVGSGLYGLTFNYLARKNGYKCLIVEKRSHIGGNIYTPIIDGIPIHQYGPHIFHTSNKEVWDFVCSLCKMNGFINSPIAIYKDEVYNLPFNMNTFSKMFNVIQPQEAEGIINNEIKQHNIIEPSNFEEQAISMVGNTVYRKLIKEYTEKQWGRDCKELSPTIIKRIPYRFTFDNNYFNDTYQGVPEKGYQELIESLLGDTEVVFSDYLSNKKFFNSLGEYVVYTGPIDAYFNYSEGHLEWRSCRFETEKKDVRNFQGNAIVNYTSHDVPYTRIIEHKFFDKSLNAFNENYTYISKEFPVEWEKGMEPFYPINNDANRARYQLYKEKSLQEQNVVFGGRLGTYRYYDMDDTILSAMFDFNEIIKNFEPLKMWVISHKDGDELFNYDKCYSFIHVGADINPNTKHLIKDNIGDNISVKNPNYCELTGMYWVWKNAVKTKYIGFEHYRRHFSITSEEIINILQEKDIIVPWQIYFLDGTSVKDGHSIFHGDYSNLTCEYLVKTMYPEYSESWDKYINNYHGCYLFNMFITTWEIFDKMCIFVFSILNAMENCFLIKDSAEWENFIKITYFQKHEETETDTIKEQVRLLGHLSERLTSLYIMHNFPENRIQEIEVITNDDLRR